MALVPITLENNEIINVEITLDSEKEFSVNARELHVGLQIRRDFSTWIKKMISYGFVENQDYIKAEGVFTQNGENSNKGGRPMTEYYLTVDMAKHLCMIQRNSIGMQIRNYFIQAEKELRTTQQVRILSPLEILEQQVKIMKDQQRQLDQHTEDIKDIRKYQSGVVFHQQKVNKDIQTRLSQHDQDISGIKQTLSGVISPREEIKNVVNLAVKKYSMDHQEAYRIVYEQIEEACKINLSDRLNKLKKRLQDNGATKTKVDGATKLDAIDQDPGIWKLIFEVLDTLRRYIEADK